MGRSLLNTSKVWFLLLLSQLTDRMPVSAVPLDVRTRTSKEAAERDEMQKRVACTMDLRLLPYPQEVKLGRGRLPLGPADYSTDGANARPSSPPSPTERITMESLSHFLPRTGQPIPVRLGSVEEGYVTSWLTPSQRSFLTSESTSSEAYVLTIAPRGATIVGKGKWGMLYGVQTVNQLAREASHARRTTLPCLTIRDWPDMKWRCLAPTLTWYSGWNRLEGYDVCNWSLGEWRWLVDWSLLHKCNAWAVCMYGYWPFSLPGYEEATLQVDSFFFDPATGRKTPWRFVHPNIKSEFFPEVLRYANERGIAVHAYIGKNSFNGGYLLRHPDANAGGAAEMLPFHPAFDGYVDAFIGRILELGFNGFVFEDPEAYHVPNKNEECYKAFWEPWAKTYGFHSREETDQNRPPLGVHVEYYTWLFRKFDAAIQRHAQRLGRRPEIHLISHFLLSRVLAESRSQEERAKWLALIDEKQGCKVHYVVAEATEKEYVDLLGGDRVSSLGGRGGSCTCAMRRICSVNNNWLPGPMGTGVDWERECQRRICQAGGNGAMGYVFEWRLNEVFGYIMAQHLWRNAGVPGINNEDQVGFLDYAYRVHYGDRVGALVARALDGGSNVNDAMVMEGIYGSQYPHTGQPLHRDYQLLAAQADEAARLAWEAYRQFTGGEPDLERALYRSGAFRWDGYNAQADHLFKAETLRRLCVSTRRSQRMCEAALAHRLAMRVTAEGATVKTILEHLGRALAAAEENQRLYQLNYDDDYDWTDGLCVKLTERLKQVSEFALLAAAGGGEIVKEWTFNIPGDLKGWGRVYDLTPPIVEDGKLRAEATGPDPQLLHTEPLALPVTARHFVELEMSSDKPGVAELFWTDRREGEGEWDPFDFRQHPPVRFEVKSGERAFIYHLKPLWKGTLTGLRLDTPDGAKIGLRALRLRRTPEGDMRTRLNLDQPAPETLRWSAHPVLFIPWEKETDIVPSKRKAQRPGLYLSVDLGLNANRDYYCHGVVFTAQVRENNGTWRTILRRTLGKNPRSWEHWDVALPQSEIRNPKSFRFLTDSYSRAQDRSWPSWQWALWGKPQLVEVTEDGQRRVVYDFIERLADVHPFVRLDADGKDRPFDGQGEDSTGATFQPVEPSPIERLRQRAGRAWQWVEGFEKSAAGVNVHHGDYRCFLGAVPSWWGYAEEGGMVVWSTEPVSERKETAIVFVGGTDYVPGKAELSCDGHRLLEFDTGRSADARWHEGKVELRYFHGGDTRDERIPYGLSGVFMLRVPATCVKPGQPLNLSVKMLSGGHAWFMLHGCQNAMRASKLAAPPDPAMPCIAAFTPHRNGAFGVTGAEYEMPLKRGLER